MPAGHRYARETVDSTLLSGVHDRQRRVERGIEKIDLQRARRYGMKEFQSNGRIKYTYGGIVFIYCPRANRAVTSFPSRDHSAETSGTKVATPILLDKAKYGSEAERQNSENFHRVFGTLLNKSDEYRSKWKSHSVLVVDMSGSMRKDDVNGARCRSDGVWMALARDYVKTPLEKLSRDHFDLISIVIMKDDAQVVVQHEPTTWALYDKLVDMREWTDFRPSGPGNYLPAIDKAENLLTSNAHAGCALSILFFSDGRPSDPVHNHPEIVERIGNLASKFGRRLSLTCIGMAEQGEDFSTLNDMVTEAQQYGAQASFGKPSLDADSLSNIITSLASSLTTSKTEMTELNTGKAKLLRMDIKREKLNTPDSIGNWTQYTNNYDGNTNYVNRIWSWNTRHRNGFVEVIDTRCGNCFEENAKNECPSCRSYSLCTYCFCFNDPGFRVHQSRYNSHRSECSFLLSQRRSGHIVIKELPSFSIAVKEQYFGEGAERLVRKVRHLDANGNFQGPVMVAKESRFIESHGGSYQEQMDYHKEFMRTQNIASDFAKKFNEALLQVEGHFLGEQSKGVIRKLPRMHFLEPTVVEVKHEGEERNILVEEFLEGDYKKFNSNMGYVEKDVADLVGRMNNLGLGGMGGGRISNGLGAIVEGDSEEDSDSDEEEGDVENIFDSKESVPQGGSYRDLQDAYFPQAFSHFSYEKSKHMFMVVDLQGVFTINADGTKCYNLTDPVVHKNRKKKQQITKHWSFGRTDRGEKGMKAFFETHHCTDACRILGLTET